jgi:hypothetical protein
VQVFLLTSHIADARGQEKNLHIELVINTATISASKEFPDRISVEGEGTANIHHRCTATYMFIPGKLNL